MPKGRRLALGSGLLVLSLLSGCGSSRAAPAYSAQKLASCLNQHHVGDGTDISTLADIAPTLRPFYPPGLEAVLDVAVPFSDLRLNVFHSSQDAQRGEHELVELLLLGTKGTKTSKSFARYFDQALTPVQIAGLHHVIRNIVVVWFYPGRTVKGTKRYLSPCLSIALTRS